MKKNIEEELDLPEGPAIELDDTPEDSTNSIDDIDKDYRITRNAIMKAIVRSSEVLDEATKLVKSAPFPNQITAASTVIKALAENAEKLLDIHAKIREIGTEKKEQNGNLKENKDFQGNLRDILKVINGGGK